MDMKFEITHAIRREYGDKQITKEMLEKGIKDGVVTFISEEEAFTPGKLGDPEAHRGPGVMCRIAKPGDKDWSIGFYFAGCEGEEGPEAYMKNTELSDNIVMIQDLLAEMKKDDEAFDEWLLYYLILMGK